MRPIEYIRLKKFNVTQSVFGQIAGVSQATVSKWEAGTSAPTSNEMARIRSAGIKLGIDWDDQWFFVVPIVDRQPTEARP